MDHLKGVELLQTVGEHLCRIVTGGMDTALTFTTESNQVVIPADDLAGRSVKIERESRQIAAQIVDMENQVFRKVLRFMPDNPAGTQWGEAEFVAGRADGLDARQPEIPENVFRAKRGQKTATAASTWMSISRPVSAFSLSSASERGLTVHTVQ